MYSARLEPGFRIGPYELLLKIGQGGMASVWLAREDRVAGFVAIKTVLPEHAEDAVLRTMMIDEALIAQSIHHPNVARVMSVGELWGMPYLVLEYVPGQSLEAICDEREGDEPMPFGVLSRLVVDTCAGLQAAHDLVGEDSASLGLVHRDLSTHNVLVDENGQVKLIDFGIAKVNERLTKTASGLTKGKLPYMAPEQALGLPVDRRADLWSLGAVMVELLTGAPPFEGDDNEGLMDKLSGLPPAPLPERVPPALREVIAKTLSFEPNDRYATAAELAEAVAAAVTPASYEDVAEVVRERLGASLSFRKRAVEQALAAAAARAEARELLREGAPSSRRTVAPERAREKTRDRERSGDGSRQSLRYVAVAAVALVVLAAYVLGAQSGKAGQMPRDSIGDNEGGLELVTSAARPAATRAPSKEQPAASGSGPRSEAPSPLLASPVLSSFASFDGGADASSDASRADAASSEETIY